MLSFDEMFFDRHSYVLRIKNDKLFKYETKMLTIVWVFFVRFVMIYDHDEV